MLRAARALQRFFLPLAVGPGDEPKSTRVQSTWMIFAPLSACRSLLGKLEAVVINGCMEGSGVHSVCIGRHRPG